jgi:hypothetical protein
MNPWLFAALVSLSVLVLAIISHLAMRKQVRKVIENNHCKVVRISWAPFSIHSFEEGSNTVFDVTYKTPKGDTVSTLCKANFFGVYWLSQSPDSYK